MILMIFLGNLNDEQSNRLIKSSDVLDSGGTLASVRSKIKAPLAYS